MVEKVDELVLIGQAAYVASVGYGDVYRFGVDEVITGTLDEASIAITILAGDTEHAAFLAGHPYPRRIVISLTRGAPDEPYTFAPVSGFVDSNRTSWLIREMREQDT
jgi:hypothetical protein